MLRPHKLTSVARHSPALIGNGWTHVPHHQPLSRRSLPLLPCAASVIATARAQATRSAESEVRHLRHCRPAHQGAALGHPQLQSDEGTSRPRRHRRQPLLRPAPETDVAHLTVSEQSYLLVAMKRTTDGDSGECESSGSHLGGCAMRSNCSAALSSMLSAP